LIHIAIIDYYIDRLHYIDTLRQPYAFAIDDDTLAIITLIIFISQYAIIDIDLLRRLRYALLLLPPLIDSCHYDCH